MATGCEDAETQAAVERSRQITAASQQYPGAYFEADREQALQALAGGLGDEADAGAIIQAAAARDIAAARLNEAAVLEAENRGDRAAMAGIARGAMRLTSLSNAFTSFDQSANAAAIDAAGAEAAETLGAMQTAIADLERPVADLEAQNQQDRQQIERLRTQARQLYDKAFELGDLNGFPSFQQAIDLDKQADAIEDRVVQREIELLDLQSQLGFAQAHATELQNQIDSAAQARAALDDSATQLEGAAAAMTTQNSAFGRTFQEALGRVQQRMDQLAGIYDGAASKIDEAARLAQGQGAGIIRVRAQLLKGELNQMRARGLADHVALLTTLASAGSVGDAGQFRSALDSASQELEAANQAAAAAYQEASQALNSVGGSSAQTARLRQQLDAATGGASAPPAPPAPTQPETPPADEPADSPESTGDGTSDPSS
jgi:predicted  nucleic acid-binding Zn-ribbon protein